MTVTHGLESCSVVELRRYTLHPGAAPDLLRVFEARLVEAQEQAGMIIAGTFLDEGDPDAFVWLRGFAGHVERTAALSAFYGGPVWARNAGAANATMVDSDNVLLLRPVDPARPPQPAVDRGDVDTPSTRHRLVLEVVEVPAGRAGDEAEAWLAGEGAAALEQALEVPVAVWRTDPTPNGFPQLPVRDDRVVVWLAAFPDTEARARALERLDNTPVHREVDDRAANRRRVLVQPTARSAHPAPIRLRYTPVPTSLL